MMEKFTTIMKVFWAVWTIAVYVAHPLGYVSFEFAALAMILAAVNMGLLND